MGATPASAMTRSTLAALMPSSAKSRVAATRIRSRGLGPPIAGAPLEADGREWSLLQKCEGTGQTLQACRMHLSHTYMPPGPEGVDRDDDPDPDRTKATAGGRAAAAAGGCRADHRPGGRAAGMVAEVRRRARRGARLRRA